MIQTNKITCMLILSLVAVLNDAQSQAAQTVPVDFTHDITVVGDATTQVAGGVLTVSNISDLNVDGIKPDVATLTGGMGATKWTTIFDDSVFALQTGSSINLVVYGVSDGNPMTSPSGLRKVGDRFQMSAEFDVGDPIDVDILDHNGIVVFSRHNVDPGNIDILIERNGDDGPLGYTFEDLNYCFWSMSFSGANTDGASFFDLDTGNLLAVGRTIVAREIVAEAGVMVNDALITGRNLQPINIHSMTLEVVPEPSAATLALVVLIVAVLFAGRLR